MNLPKVIYIMGPPGSGKGTQAELLAHQINYHRFSTGDAFRSLARQDTALGRQVKDLIDNGYFAPPELAAEIVIAAVAVHLRAGHGLVFDGTPRTLEEARLVDAFFAANGYGRPLAIVLAISREEMIKRNSKRRFCLGILGDFPVVSAADAKRCQELGGQIGTRPDDEPAKFAARWQQFQDRALPVIEQYRQQGLAHTIDGSQPVAAVHDAITRLLTSLNQPTAPA